MINGALRQNLLHKPQGFLSGRKRKSSADPVSYGESSKVDFRLVSRRSQGWGRVRLQRTLCGFGQRPKFSRNRYFALLRAIHVVSQDVYWSK